MVSTGAELFELAASLLATRDGMASISPHVDERLVVRMAVEPLGREPGIEERDREGDLLLEWTLSQFV
jgi:hypothetical protein